MTSIIIGQTPDYSPLIDIAHGADESELDVLATEILSRGDIEEITALHFLAPTLRPDEIAEALLATPSGMATLLVMTELDPVPCVLALLDADRFDVIESTAVSASKDRRARIARVLDRATGRELAKRYRARARLDPSAP